MRVSYLKPKRQEQLSFCILEAQITWVLVRLSGRNWRKGREGIWIHTSGIDNFLPPGKRGVLKGEKKSFDDWEMVGECLSLLGRHSFSR